MSDKTTDWQGKYIELLLENNAGLKRRVKELQLRDYRRQEKMEKLMLHFNLPALKNADGEIHPETLTKS